MVTILFDMFFTVILFKKMYSKLVNLAGFTVAGREWIANGFVSTVISVLTFEVYANMTRFQWAYPSGTEGVFNQWISGPTMVLACVIMSMVYLTSETRTRVGEPGINNPNVKIGVVGITFLLLYYLSAWGYIDPSRTDASAASGPTGLAANFQDISLPLKNVCKTKARGVQGFVVFFVIATLCLAFVVFVTSAQSLSGFLGACCPCCRVKDHGAEDASQPADPSQPPPPAHPPNRKSSLPGTGLPSHRASNLTPEELKERRRKRSSINHHRAVEQAKDRSNRDRIYGKCAIFALYMLVTAFIVFFFAFWPVYKIDAKHGQRNVAAWKAACDAYDVGALTKLGLS